MTHDEWERGNAVVEKWGLRLPLADVGGVLECVLSDYSPGGTGTLRIPEPTPRPWDHIARDYWIIGPQYGERERGMRCELEAVAAILLGKFGTVFCTSTIEHSRTPFALVSAIAAVLRVGGLTYLSAPFQWPVHGDPAEDYWRFTESGLRQLASHSGLAVLESGTSRPAGGRETTWIAASRGGLDPCQGPATVQRPVLVKA